MTGVVNTQSVRSALALLILSALVAGCTRNGIVSFSVEPQLVCPNQPVLVAWEVRGRAALRATPTPPAWSEQPIVSKGELRLPVAANTSFTLTALDANPADGNSFGNKRVQVNPKDNDRAVSAQCDATTRQCTGTLELSSGGSVQVSKLSDPTFVQSGKRQPRAVCVTSPAGQRTCIAPEQSAPSLSLVDGQWTFDAALAPGEAPDPPPQLRMHFDFGCP